MIDHPDIFQSSWYVRDIDAAMDRWRRLSGVGPFFVVRRAELHVSHRGTPTLITISGAMAQAGSMQIELIQQIEDGPSPYRDVYASRGEGFHHVAAYVPDLDRAVAHYATDDIHPAMIGTHGPIRVAYMDTWASLGCMTEIVEDGPAIRGLSALVRDAAIDWDGNDPIREL